MFQWAISSWLLHATLVDVISACSINDFTFHPQDLH